MPIKIPDKCFHGGKIHFMEEVMNISTGGRDSIIVQCIRQVNQMLKNISLSEMRTTENRINSEVYEKPDGIGEKIDTSV